MSLDAALFLKLNGLSHLSGFLDLAGVVLASYFAYVLVLLVLAVLVLEPDWKVRLYKFSLLALSLILARGVIVQTIKFLYNRPRPFTEFNLVPLVQGVSDPSFPSGHAAVFFALATAGYFINRKLGLWLYLGAALIGVGRIFAGLHYPSDIIAGALVGIVSAYLVRYLLRRTSQAFS